MQDFVEKQESATPILCDNKSAIAMSKNPIYHGKSKHIALKHHYIRGVVEDKEMDVVYCKTEDQVADIFTKALPKDKFIYLIKLLGVKQQSIKRSVKVNPLL
ncbi:hypothetical protein ACFX19_007645 [Malus domestica]